MYRVLSAVAVATLLALSAAGAPEPRRGVAVVRDGQPTAVVVLPEPTTAVARFAAEELAAHIRKATGVDLGIVSERAIPATPAGRIYLGNCAATRAAGIQVSQLPAEAFVLRTNGPAIFICGDDGGADPLDPDTRAGTLFGVYEWLERTLKVRWMWPGELGTFVPRTPAVLAPAMDDRVSPVFFQRRVRSGLGVAPQNPALGFTPKAYERYAREQTLFLRRHRFGRSVRMSYGHAFTDWWQKLGAQHPEWFQQQANGRRGPARAGARYSMCVSDAGLQQEIVRRWEAAGGARASSETFINAVENDTPGLCTCERCLAADGPAPADYARYTSPKSRIYGARFVSDRYARFWLELQRQAARLNPRATVIGYAYFNYFQAPTSGVKLNPNVLVGFCPSGGWYPRSPDEQAWYQRQWSGWRSTGARLFSRTNYFLDGYCMPFIFAHQFADDFQYAARNGMVATDFDSLTGQWATQGPNLYLLMRLHTRPTAPADELLAEYYAGFGAAAAEVKAYFDYWERYTQDQAPRLNQEFEELQASRWRTWAKVVHVVFPPACFAPARAILARAATAAVREPEAAARVAFLRKGLEHAELSARAAAVLSLARAEAPEPERKKMLRELVTFRRGLENDGIGNLNQLAWVEDLSWKLPAEARQPAELYP